MKKSIWIFLLAVLLPSVVLGWLALRSADEQQIILENRTAALYQKETENAAVAARSLIDEVRHAFNETVRQLLAKADPQALANNFSTELAKAWPRKAIGFSIGNTGYLCAPLPQRAKTNPAWEKFLLGNGSFLAGTTRRRSTGFPVTSSPSRINSANRKRAPTSQRTRRAASTRTTA